MFCVKSFLFLVGLMFCGNFSCSVSPTEKSHSFNNLIDTSSAETVTSASTSDSTLRTASSTGRTTTKMSSEESTTVQPSLSTTVIDSTTDETSRGTVSESPSTSTTSEAPDECELKGACKVDGDFLALGECENCYCRCAYNSSTTLEWKKLCCDTDPPSVFDPYAWPNPNSCDTCEHMEIVLGKCTNDGNYCSGSNKQNSSFTGNTILFFIIAKFFCNSI